MKLLKNKKVILLISGMVALVLTAIFGVDQKTANQIATSCSNRVEQK